MKPLQIHTDTLTRRLYATDASIYEELPQGVCFPSSAEDLKELVRKAAGEGFSIVPRSAGTSLAGQTTGSGVVVDVSRYMTKILSIESVDRKREEFVTEGETQISRGMARVQPGVIRDTLNREAAQYRLQFGPDTSTTNRCMIGGMIGNNSSGSYSVKYQTTREHTLEVRAILSDGSEATFGPITPNELHQKKQESTLEGAIYRGMNDLLEEHRNLIQKTYPHPEILRRNTGYALDKLLEMEPFTPGGPPFNLSALLCGSEGTLALTAEATLQLVPLPSEKILLIPQFENLQQALIATREAVRWDISAAELLDYHVLDATKGNIEQKRNRFFLEGDPKSLLIIQMEGEDPNELLDRAETLATHLKSSDLGYAHPILTDPTAMKRVWDLRKAGLGLLMGLGSESRSPSFVEDTAVRVEDLPAYAADFQRILDRHGLSCVFYAHASVGELHLRPILDTTTESGVQRMKTVAREVAELVKQYRGSLSGEHGDGRVRAPFIETVLGSDMIPVLRRVKQIWDPHNLFNPGKIVDPLPMEQNLRYSPAYKAPNIPTTFHWRDTKGFDNALSQCNGAGVCRKLAASGGTMCPSYHATLEEKDNTRGRANLFRQLFEGEGTQAFQSQELKEALDLCLSCKACKSECPASVDMARMKAEFIHGWHQANGRSLADRFFGQPDKLYPSASGFSSRLAAQLAPVVNAINHSTVGKKVFSGLMGVDPRRPLPSFSKTPFYQHYLDTLCDQDTTQSPSKPSAESFAKSPAQSPALSPAQSPALSPAPKTLLLVDIFTNHHEPKIAVSALNLLRHIGIEPVIPGIFPTGRPQISRGLLGEAKSICHQTIRRLKPYIERGYSVVGLEPSELLTLRDEYLDLCDEALRADAEALAAQSFLLEEFLLRHIERFEHVPGSLAASGTSDKDSPHVVVHGHCHTKALVGNAPLIELLQRLGLTVTELQTGCCGMAGSFGYEKSKYDVSMTIAEQTLFPALRNTPESTRVCAPGFSCRHQIHDGLSRQADHPATILAEAILP